jgi:hypothetical protein
MRLAIESFTNAFSMAVSGFYPNENATETDVMTAVYAYSSSVIRNNGVNFTIFVYDCIPKRGKFSELRNHEIDIPVSTRLSAEEFLSSRIFISGNEKIPIPELVLNRLLDTAAKRLFNGQFSEFSTDRFIFVKNRILNEENLGDIIINEFGHFLVVDNREKCGRIMSRTTKYLSEKFKTESHVRGTDIKNARNFIIDALNRKTNEQ